MEVILTHEQADFDAAGSVLAAWLLDPTRIPVLPKRRNRNLSAFLDTYPYPFHTWNTVPRGAVTRVLLVDTQMLTPHKRIQNTSEIVVIDHHQNRGLLPEHEGQIIEPLGACTTILVEKLMERDIYPGSLYATLMLAGIYEDTGFLSYGSVTPRDLHAAAWLLERGADVDVVRRCITAPLTEHQQQVCDQLLRHCESVDICGERFIIAMADVREVADEYSTAAHYLRDMLSPDGLLLILGTKAGLRIIGRATNDEINLGALMRAHNGGGHSRAASGLAPVEGEVADIFPLMRSLRNELVEELPAYITNPRGKERDAEMAELMREQLPEESLTLIRKTAETAAELKMPIYLVGGVVRDLLLGRPVTDFDFVTEGEAVALGKALTRSVGGSIVPHNQFHTAKWQLPDGRRLDLISARKETYPSPASLPVVERGSIEDDLRRRDFTMNTLAVRLDGVHYGELIDRLGGMADIFARRIRVLHDDSFTDDPTRMFRAVRFEQRFDFPIETETAEQLEHCRGNIALLTGQRIFHELRLMCAESAPERCFARLTELGLTEEICSWLYWGESDSCECRKLRRAEGSFEPEWILRVWWSRFSAEEINELSDRLALSGSARKDIHALAVLRRKFYSCRGKKNSETAFFLDSMPESALRCYARLIEDVSLKAVLTAYLDEWRHTRPFHNGEDLIRLGVPGGPGMRDLLRTLRGARIDGAVKNREDERELIERLRNHEEKHG